MRTPVTVEHFECLKKRFIYPIKYYYDINFTDIVLVEHSDRRSRNPQRMTLMSILHVYECAHESISSADTSQRESVLPCERLEEETGD